MRKRLKIPYDPIRTLVTPEGVALHLVLPNISERVFAFVMDVMVIGALLLMMSLGAGLLLVSTGGEVAGIVWVLCFFLLRNFYFVYFELRPRGATLGKRAMDLRVTTRQGGRLSVNAILARNMVRELELFLPLSFLALEGREASGWLLLLGLGWAGLFLLFPLFNRDRLRVGDLLGGTWVVRQPRRKLLPDLAASASGWATLEFTQAQVGAYGIKELHVLEDVLRAGDAVTMKAVAERIAAKIVWVRGVETDNEFLGAYYRALRTGLERGLLFGRRRLDKFDTGREAKLS